MMNQILNFGLPAPIDIKIIGGDYKNYKLAQEIEAQVKRCPRRRGRPRAPDHEPARAAGRGRPHARRAARPHAARDRGELSSSPPARAWWSRPTTGTIRRPAAPTRSWWCSRTTPRSIRSMRCSDIPLPGKGQSPTQSAGQRRHGEARDHAGDHQPREHRARVRRVRQRPGPRPRAAWPPTSQGSSTSSGRRRTQQKNNTRIEIGRPGGEHVRRLHAHGHRPDVRGAAGLPHHGDQLPVVDRPVHHHHGAAAGAAAESSGCCS